MSASDRTWKLAKKYWENCQNADGSWSYNSTRHPRHRQHDLRRHHLAGDRRRPGAVERRPGRSATASTAAWPTNRDDADRIERGLQWLGQHYSVTPQSRAPAATWLLYYLYGLERAGRLTARRFIPLPARPGQPDRADWYREGADQLVRNQDSSVGLLGGRGPWRKRIR